MKSKIFTCSLLLCLSAFQATACGVFYSLTPNPLHFCFPEKYGSCTPYEDENIILWQQLTSPSIPKADIKEAVYKFTYTELKDAFDGYGKSNSFIDWICREEVRDLEEFLLLAKEVEEIREHHISPWYYPSDVTGFDESADEQSRYNDILDRCRQHQSGRLADRYALQAIRMMLSFGEYNNLVNYYRSTLAKLPDTNYFKHDAKGYYAGALMRLGHTEEANEIFAELGDVLSIKAVGGEHRYIRMAAACPESQVLKSWLNNVIGYTHYSRVDSIADAALGSKNLLNRGDWLYLKAYCQAVYRDNYKEAAEWIRKARSQKFSDPKLSEDARYFDICVRAKCGDIRNYRQDAIWMLREYKNRNGLWFFVIPEMLRRGLTNDALLLANYDTEPTLPKDKILWNNKRYRPIRFAQLMKEYYEDFDEYYKYDDISYINTGFQLLQSLKAADVICYREYLRTAPTSFVSELKPRVRKDNEFFDELIGTLYLREGDYDKAAQYLKKVSAGFQKELGIYDYLQYDPMQNYTLIQDEWDNIPSRRYSYYYNKYYDDDPEVYEDLPYDCCDAQPQKLLTATNAKYNFAREMSRLQRIMKNDPSADRRAIARLRFAIGRLNSFDSCWALTEYWNGDTGQRNYDYFYYHLGDCIGLDYLQDTPKEAEGILRWYFKELIESIRNIKDQEIMAEAQLLLHNYRTIARHYPATSIGRYLSTRCDHWKDWL